MRRSPLFSIALAFAAFALQAEGPPLATVTFARPTRGDVNRSVTLPGSVLPYQQATLYAKVAGYLKSISVDRGDAVKAGQTLAEIEVPELLADRTKFVAEANVARLDYERMKEAEQKAPDLVMPQHVDDARGKWEVAKANLERIDTLLRYASIVAPFDGVVTRRMVDAGAFIPAATSGSSAQTAAVLTLMDFSRVRVQVAVPEREAAIVRKGCAVRVSLEGLRGRVFEGAITRISYALDEATRSMPVEAELRNPQGELRPGMYASVQIVLEAKSDALLVPASAVVSDKNESVVFALVDHTARRQSVKTGVSDGSRTEILQGLKLDQPVILVGKQAIKDGQAVNANEAK
jgi:membrane fusion protein (multidrug efflux system)